MSGDDDLLVRRLRIQQHERTAVGDGYLFGEAADEIERLRFALERIFESGAYPEAAIAQDALRENA
jgi:hypothetical protein